MFDLDQFVGRRRSSAQGSQPQASLPCGALCDKYEAEESNDGDKQNEPHCVISRSIAQDHPNLHPESGAIWAGK
jgi:hypothetical protein